MQTQTPSTKWGIVHPGQVHDVSKLVIRPAICDPENSWSVIEVGRRNEAGERDTCHLAAVTHAEADEFVKAAKAIAAKPEHTPAPWSFHDREVFRVIENGIHIKRQAVASCHAYTGGHPDFPSTIQEQRANVRLIAGAPKMFKELDAIAAALEDGDTVTIEPGSVKADRIRRLLFSITEGK